MITVNTAANNQHGISRQITSVRFLNPADKQNPRLPWRNYLGGQARAGVPQINIELVGNH
jgi:hypothetical protein